MAPVRSTPAGGRESVAERAGRGTRRGTPPEIVARGGFVTGARVPPLQAATASQIAEAVRIGPYLMPRFTVAQISQAQLNSIIA